MAHIGGRPVGVGFALALTAGLLAAPAPATVAQDGTAPDCPNMPTEPITLTYWEASGLYLSDDGVAQLDQEFMEKYPNVTLERVARAFNDIIATERNIVGNIVGTYNELAELMALAQSGRVTLHTRVYPLDAAVEAFQDLDAGRVRGRAILVP